MSTNHISTISYVPQPFFYPSGGSQYLCEVSLTADSPYAEWESMTNEEGLFNPKLADATEFVTSLNNQSPYVGESLAFTISFGHFKNGISNMRGTTTVALIGCSLLSYADDGSGDPDPDTEREEFITYTLETTNLVQGSTNSGKGFAYNSNNKITTFCAERMPSVISGGQCNLIVSGLGKFQAGAAEAEVRVIIHAYRIGRKHLKFKVGHLFVGMDLDVNTDPRSFVWGLGVENERAQSRNYSAISSDGTLRREVSGDFYKMGYYDLNGSEIRFIHADNIIETIYPDANVLDMIKSNTSYPILFNPYPYGAVDGTLTKEQFTMMGRQNFFSVYGFFKSFVDIQTGEYREGLNTNYKMKFRVEETR